MEKINLQHEATSIFKTIKLCEKPYTIGYIARLVTGDTKFELKELAHKNLETYGSLEDHHSGYVEEIIQLLISRHYILVKNQIYGNLILSKLGQKFLDNPFPLEVSKTILYKPWHEVQMSIQLRKWRQESAERHQLKPYEIATNYVLQQIMIIQPMSQMEISRIIGTENIGIEEGEELIGIIQDIQLKKQEDDRSGLYRRVYSKKGRKVKELFQANIPLEDIGRRQGMQMRELRDMLISLHTARELDLKSWIEKQIPSADLHKGTDYFRKAEDQTLSHARQVLGLDYDTLGWCKAYVVHESVMTEAA